MKEYGQIKDRFGRKCVIPTGEDGHPALYRIIRSRTRSNAWHETPLLSGALSVAHGEMRSVLYVVEDQVDTESEIFRVAEKDIEYCPEGE